MDVGVEVVWLCVAELGSEIGSDVKESKKDWGEGRSLGELVKYPGLWSEEMKPKELSCDEEPWSDRGELISG